MSHEPTIKFLLASCALLKIMPYGKYRTAVPMRKMTDNAARQKFSPSCTRLVLEQYNDTTRLHPRHLVRRAPVVAPGPCPGRRLSATARAPASGAHACADAADDRQPQRAQSPSGGLFAGRLPGARTRAGAPAARAVFDFDRQFGPRFAAGGNERAPAHRRHA